MFSYFRNMKLKCKQNKSVRIFRPFYFFANAPFKQFQFFQFRISQEKRFFQIYFKFLRTDTTPENRQTVNSLKQRKYDNKFSCTNVSLQYSAFQIAQNIEVPGVARRIFYIEKKTSKF